MENSTSPLLGIHHVTAITSDAQQNVDFYTGLLGLRLVKVTVNFDDPGAYHLYYGDEIGHPGTILTFFAWPGAPFFFSSRRRHTRSLCDWSSDVCSSDLHLAISRLGRKVSDLKRIAITHGHRSHL